MLKERRANLYVIDNQLDGAFSGFEILARLRKQWSNVPAVLIDAAASPEAEKARAMTGVTLIPSSGNTNDIAQKLAAVTVRNQVVISKAARELVERQHNLPVMSRLVSRLVEYLGMTPDEVSLSELCRELTLDPKAALLVLKAANASSNGVSREIVNVQDAIRLLGVQRALGHVLASTVTDGTEQLAKGVLGEQRKWHARRGISDRHHRVDLCRKTRRPLERDRPPVGHPAGRRHPALPPPVSGPVRRLVAAVANERAPQAGGARADGTGLHACRGLRRTPGLLGHARRHHPPRDAPPRIDA